MKCNYYFLILLVATIGTSCKPNFDEMLTTSLEQKDYVPVRVQTLQSTDEVIPIYAMGRVSSDTETKLSFKTGGYIKRLYVREGDYVRKGKLLGSLQTDEIDAQVSKAQRLIDKQVRDLERAEAMYQDSVATLENVQDLTTLVEVSKEDLSIALYNQRYSKIINPINGRVIRRLAESNELVSPGQPIFVIASSGRQSYIMKVFVSDKDIDMVTYGSTGKITFDAFANSVFDARVNRIAESADPMTGSFEIELTIDPGQKRLRNGMIGRATLFPSKNNKFIKIPMESISEGNGNVITIYVPNEDSSLAIEKKMSVARFGDEYVWVPKEEFSDPVIITTGSAYLKEGQKIRILNQ